jgi:hypothetical protein
MAEDGGVEPHPISQNPVFKAGRSTNTAASSSVTLVPDSGNDPLAYRLSSDCSTSELIGNIFGTKRRDRTAHAQIFSLSLYQLSYLGIIFFGVTTGN